MSIRKLLTASVFLTLAFSVIAHGTEVGSIGPAARAEAQSLAGTDTLLNRALVLCDPNPDRTEIAKQEELPAARIFDNLYFLGNKSVSAWLWEGPDGFVLIDTLSSAEEAAQILSGLQNFGIDPVRIKRVIITHGHFDHSGGAQFLRNKLSSALFAMTEQTYRVALQENSSHGAAFPKADIILTDGMRWHGGLRIVETPGHSPGTTSVILPVRAGNSTYVASLLGGSASYRLPDRDLRAYSSSTRRFAAIAAASGSDYVISNHQAIDSTRSWIDGLAQGIAPAPMPRKQIRNYYRIVDLCARSHLKL